MTGLDIIRAIQSIHSNLLDQAFLVITDLHSENIYIFLLPVLLWLYDKRFARFMTSVFMLSYWSNNVLKDLFDTARPTADQVRIVRPETSGAFPSGHSMTPLMFWGALALQLRRTWVTVAAVALCLLIGLSRLYLGVHWPIDVLGGWAIGGLMLWAFEASRGFWMGEKMSLGARLGWAVAIPAGAAAISVALGQMPPLTAVDTGHFFLVLGAFLGLNVGSALEEEYVGFDPRLGSVGAQAVKLVLGLVLLFAVKEGFKLFLPHNGLGDVIRYFFVGAMATWGAPWVFNRFITPPMVRRAIGG